MIQRPSQDSQITRVCLRLELTEFTRSMESEVGCVIGVESYKHSARRFIRLRDLEKAASEALRRRAARVMASSFVPMPDNSHFQNGNIIHGAGPNGGAARGDSISAAVWNSGISP